MALAWPPKDPDEVLDYQIDWTERLNGDTISTSAWTISAADEASPTLTEDSNDIVSGNTVIWLSSGTIGIRYSLTNRITTAAGRTMDQTVYLRVKSK